MAEVVDNTDGVSENSLVDLCDSGKSPPDPFKLFIKNATKIKDAKQLQLNIQTNHAINSTVTYHSHNNYIVTVHTESDQNSITNST